MSVCPIVADPLARIDRARRVAAVASNQVLVRLDAMRHSLGDVEGDLYRIADALDEMSTRMADSLLSTAGLRECLEAADAAHADGGMMALEAARDRLAAWISASA